MQACVDTCVSLVSIMLGGHSHNKVQILSQMNTEGGHTHGSVYTTLYVHMDIWTCLHMFVSKFVFFFQHDLHF